MSGCGRVTITIELVSRPPIQKSYSAVKLNTDLQECVAGGGDLLIYESFAEGRLECNLVNVELFAKVCCVDERR